MFTTHIYVIYMYKMDLALNNQQWLICHITKPNQNQPNLISTTSPNKSGPGRNGDAPHSSYL